MTTLAEIDAGLRQPGLTLLDRVELLMQRKRACYAHSPTITPHELIEAVDSRPDLQPLDGALLLRLMRNACRGTLTSAELEEILDELERAEKD